jgi:hypothetical protein
LELLLQVPVLVHLVRVSEFLLRVSSVQRVSVLLLLLLLLFLLFLLMVSMVSEKPEPLARCK